jgi:hypothetical protein
MHLCRRQKSLNPTDNIKSLQLTIPATIFSSIFGAVNGWDRRRHLIVLELELVLVLGTWGGFDFADQVLS